MKLILYSIKLEFANKRILLFHYIALMVVSYMVFQYYGAYYGTLQNEAYTGEYTVRIGLTEKFDSEKFEECTSVNGFVYSMIYSEEPIYFDENDTPYQCIGILGTPSFDIYFEGNELTENTVYIPYSMSILQGLNIGDKITISNNEYEIAGTSGLNYEIMFPISSLAADYSITSMYIYLNAEKITEDQYKDSVNQLQNIFGNSALLTADDFDETFQANLLARKVEASFLFLLGTICIVFVYAYILTKRKRRFSICSICGASQKNVSVMICIGAFLIFTLSFISSAFLGKIVNLLFFEPIFGYNTFKLTINDILLFYIIMFVIYAVVITIFVGRFIKNTAINNYRRSE